MDMSIISKLYDLFIILCMMHIGFNENDPNCNKYSGKAKEFIENYKKLKGDSSITEDSPYYKLLSTLSNDYDNFKKKCSDVNCKDILPLQSIEKTQIAVDFSERTSEQLYVQGSEVTSSFRR
ncbi:Plasmodium variant antigen protein Cir/Yir/Bir, putative [Plasmodium berghei]|uniref:Plasmodium variant antigen protein Cir/Yir/Bir, putative n=1 Tax=Plasmodium berghei TaxID=5821 RepID=A0A1D3JPH1_PLABE|nr:Plasmodium variant antigen protein Cir/Yir/Bir, putative [Plasmodium berghei]SCL82415.1 Plasmodium variant antigen protein Cir/Yir/Bir, putative [Plasmodium berghei]SCL85640.1 Plasmodium variant antigen protein Cir/Yir/Bir, putative [Plasmodium berghei]